MPEIQQTELNAVQADVANALHELRNNKPVRAYDELIDAEQRLEAVESND